MPSSDESGAPLTQGHGKTLDDYRDLGDDTRARFYELTDELFEEHPLKALAFVKRAKDKCRERQRQCNHATVEGINAD